MIKLLFSDLVAKSNCEILVTETNFDLNRHLLMNEAIKKRIRKNIQRAKRQKKFAESYGKKLISRAIYYQGREISAQMAKDDPYDIEIFYFFLLFHIAFVSKENDIIKLYQAIEITEKVIKNTYNFRKRLVD